jgi:hypothetical protein
VVWPSKLSKLEKLRLVSDYQTIKSKDDKEAVEVTKQLFGSDDEHSSDDD